MKIHNVGKMYGQKIERKNRENSLKYPSRNYPFSIYYISILYHRKNDDGNFNDIVRIVDKEKNQQINSDGLLLVIVYFFKSTFIAF